MDTQFVDFTLPDPNALYYFTPDNKTRGFTFLMKLTLMVKNYPEAFDIIHQIVKNNPEEIDKQTRDGTNVLMIAVKNCSRLSLIECIKLYIDNCIDRNKLLNSTSRNGNTPLMYAFNEFDNTYGSIFSYECIELLLKSGADVNLYNHIGLNALSLASKCNDHDKYAECIKLLLSFGANIDLDEHPVLTRCLDYGETNESVYKVCKLLIESGFTNHYQYNRTSKNIISSSILKLCNRFHNQWSTKILELLISSGCDPNILECYNYNNALIVCMANTNTNTPIEFVKCLINSTNNLDLQNEENVTALIALCGSIQIWSLRPGVLPKTVTSLLKLEPDLDKIKARCRFGDTIPTVSKYVDLLLKSGANVDLYDDNLNTALMYYCKLTFFTEKDLDTLILFIKKSSNITFKNNKGKTAYDYFMGNLQHKNITNDYIENLLKGNVPVYTNTKSARN